MRQGEAGRGEVLPFSGILTPEGAVDRVAALVDAGNPPARVEIAGPGEPLANAATSVVLRKVHWLYPDLPLSVWTNGLLLPDRLGELMDAGMRSLTISINAVKPETAERIYEWIIYRGRRYEGSAAADLLLNQQWIGFINAIEAGLTVTVYTLSIPGVNENEIPQIATRARELGADGVRVSQLIP
jgi:nitrogen fixation protein NifB